MWPLCGVYSPDPRTQARGNGSQRAWRENSMLSWWLGARLARQRGKEGSLGQRQSGSPGSTRSGQPDVAPSVPPDGWVCCSEASCWTRPLPRPNRSASLYAAPRVESGAGRKTGPVMGKTDVGEPQPRGGEGRGNHRPKPGPNLASACQPLGVNLDAYEKPGGCRREQTVKRWRRPWGRAPWPAQ